MSAYEHLELPFLARNFDRQKRSGMVIYKHQRNEENKTSFYQNQTEKLDRLKESLTTKKESYQKYFDPNLIFKLEINQSVSENTIRTELGRMNIQVISPSPDKKGIWVVFANNQDVEQLKAKLKIYKDSDSYKFFSAFESIDDIPIEEKIGEGLNLENLDTKTFSYFDVEIWNMDKIQIDKFLKGYDKKEGFSEFVKSKGGKITDILLTMSFCLLRIKANKEIIQEILGLKEVAFVDLPPKSYIEYSDLRLDINDENINIEEIPDNTCGIAILDTGVLSTHPILKKGKVVGDKVAINTIKSGHIKSEDIEDDHGHGTKVAGIAAFGDLKECISCQKFIPSAQIFSIKIMYNNVGYAEYDEEELLEHQLIRAIEYIVNNYKNCKVINMSLGNSNRKMFGNKRQFNLSLLIDILSKKHDLIFVVSAGNLTANEVFEFDYPNNYPQYLLEETKNVKIIEPATSILALTIGSIAQDCGNLDVFGPDNILVAPAKKDFPSPFTRVGLGYKNTIKPDLVELGGNLVIDKNYNVSNMNSGIPLLNRTYLKDARLFTVDRGTSFSAPRVANYLAQLINKYPTYSLNLIKALLISSADIPINRPEPLNNLDFDSASSTTSEEKRENLLKIYGYGKPNIEKALNSLDSSVILKRENKIKLDSVQVYYLNMPEEFKTTSGDKKIQVTLVYDPPINKNRIDYMGCNLEFHLFRDMEIDEVLNAYGKIKVEAIEDEVIPATLKAREINLRPGLTIRKRGVHQKGCIKYRRLDLNIDKPLVLAVVCQNKWIDIQRNPDYLQDYAVIMRVEHSQEIDLYNKIRLKNLVRVRVK